MPAALTVFPYVPVSASVRLVPVRPHAHLGQQRHLELGDTGHQARDLGPEPVNLAPQGTSKTSSSCTCMIIFVPRCSASSTCCTVTMLSLIRSAAVPCIGALMAARSAPLRRGPLGELISGRYRRRPNTVST